MSGDIKDRDYRLLVETARKWGVPFSTFMGAPSIVAIHDRAGRVIERHILPGWGDEDRDAALALALYEDSLCSRCGQPMDETCDPSNEGKYHGEDAIRCHRCTASMMVQEKYKDSPNPEALMFPVVLQRGT